MSKEIPVKYHAGDTVQLVDIDRYPGNRLELKTSDFPADRIVKLLPHPRGDHWWMIQCEKYCLSISVFLISHKIEKQAGS